MRKQSIEEVLANIQETLEKLIGKVERIDHIDVKLETLSLRVNGMIQGNEFKRQFPGNDFNPFVGSGYSQTSVSHPPLVPKSRSRLLRER